VCPCNFFGNKYGASVGRLISFKKDQGHVDGPAISDVNGRVLSHQALNESLLEVLEDTRREMFLASIPDKEMLQQRVQIYQTLRRTSDTRAPEQKVGQSDIDVVNRWKALERADGNRPHHPMRQHYAELELLIGSFLRYTLAM
jgi:hypothetical protein